MSQSKEYANVPNKHLLNARRFDLLVVVLLCIVNCLIYFPSIKGFFLADDFSHIAYLHQIFHGQPMLLLTDFYTNQTAGTEFYRPLITLSLALDYLFWGNNAIGFHISNLFFQIASTVLLYFLVKQMTASLGGRQPRAAAAIAAAFFAVYPLHPEVVSWVIGRVDSLPTMFYLAAFLLFFKYRERNRLLGRFLVLGLSLICFACSILTKEIAVTFPVAILLWLVMFDNNEVKLGTKIVGAFKSTLPYWLLLGGYLAIRTAVLGTVYGGYSGSLALKLSIFTRLFEGPSLIKLIFPFNDDLFSQRDFLRQGLNVLYGLALGAFIVRLWKKEFYKIPLRLMLYGLLWFILCLLPAFQVFDLSADLRGGRIVYLASVPICLLLSLIFLPLMSANRTTELALDINTNKRNNITFLKLIAPMSIGLCFAILVDFACVAYINNLPWRHAGDELRELQVALLEKQATIGRDKRLVLLNLPHDYKGAHMLYNGAAIDVLCSSALSGTKMPRQIITFEHPLYGDPDLINFTRLTRFLKEPSHYVFVAWHRNASRGKHNKILGALYDAFHECVGKSNYCGSLTEIDFGTHKRLNANAACNLHVGLKENPDGSSDLGKPDLIDIKPNQSHCLGWTRLNIAPDKSRLFEVSLRASDVTDKTVQKDGWLQLQWFSQDGDVPVKCGSLTQSLIIDGNTHKYLFNLSEHKSWILCNNVSELRIYTMPGKYKLQIEGARFLSSALMIPRLDTHSKLTRYEDEAGVYHLLHRQVFWLQYDASQIKGAKAVVYEISKSNFWFEHEDQTYNGNRFSSNSILRKTLPNLQGEFMVSGHDLGSDYFEVHLAAVDKDGHMLGLMSCPVCGQVGVP